MRPKHGSDTSRVMITRKILVYGVIFFLLAIIQCSFFTRLSFIPATPDLVLGTLVAISLFDSRESTAVSAVASGFIIDAIGSGGLSFSPLIFLATACLCGELTKKFLPRFITFAVSLIPAAALSAVLSALLVRITSEGVSFAALLRSAVLPEVVCTVIFSLPVYFIIRPASRFTEAKNKFKI